MNKNDLYGNQEIEKNLKEKMNGLASSVDCFDKISARAFPEKNPDFSDCELTVTDLENVTGKRRHFPVLKWVSAAAAAVICIGVLPKTAMINNLRNSLVKKSDQKSYNEIICEINRETADGDYMVYDIPLDYYSKNDVLITPFFRCPFENSGDEDARVRIFVRTCGGVFTNQLYAVEYSGEYTENNFIAAAESKAEFTDEEIEELNSSNILHLTNYECVIDAQYAFDIDQEGNLTDKNGNPISAASYGIVNYYKDDENRINSVTSEILYYRIENDENSSGYFYDISSSYIDGIEIKELDVSENSWKESVYSNGVSAFPSENDVGADNGGFTRTQLFLGKDEKYSSDNIELYYINPSVGYQVNVESEADEKTNEIISLYLIHGGSMDECNKENEVASVAAPYNLLLRNNMAIYISYDRIFLDSDNNVLVMQSSINDENISFTYVDNDENSLKSLEQNYEERLYSAKSLAEELQQNIKDIQKQLESESLSNEEIERLEVEIQNNNQQIDAMKNYQAALQEKNEWEKAEDIKNQAESVQPATNVATYG